MSASTKAKQFSAAYIEALCPPDTKQSIKDKVQTHFELGFIAGAQSATHGMSKEAFLASLAEMMPSTSRIIVP